MDNNVFGNNQNDNIAAPQGETQSNAAPIDAAPQNNPNPAAANEAPAQETHSAAPEQNARPAYYTDRVYAPQNQNSYQPMNGGYTQPQNGGYTQQNSYAQPQNNGYAPPNGYTQPQNGSAQPQHDFSRYQDTASRYTSIPRDTVYINNQPDNSNNNKKQKAPKTRMSVGAIAIVVLICMVFSGGAAFAGTYLANRMSSPVVGTDSEGNPITATGTPSVIFQSFSDGNKTAGTYEQVADAVTPTVVEITTESISTSSTFWGGSYVTSGAGSGVIISSDGLIITNNHVVSGASTITVTLKDGTEYKATLLGADSDSDIAVIKVDATGLPFALTGDSDTLTVGQEVVAVGNPLGELGGTVTNGIVSALSRDVNIDGTEMTLIQTNAAVNPGNSGGGLFNMYGELIGVVNAKSTSTSSGTSVEGIGFAIPINTATKVASELVNYGYVRGKVALGIEYVDVTSTYDAMMYGVNALGMYIAKDAGDFKAGDRVTAVDGTEVTYGADVKSLIKNYKVGDEVTVTVVRGRQYVDVKVTLKEYVPSTASQTTEDTSAFENNFNSRFGS